MITPLIALPFLLVYVVLRLISSNIHASNRQRRDKVLKDLGTSGAKKFIGFFHPYCNAGGGGERVLWVAIEFMQRTEPDVISVVYSGDNDASKEEIISKVKARFGITLNPASLHFVFLNSRRWIEDASWPRFTLLGQSLGSMYLAWEAMTQLIPDLYIDTMGYAFTFHVVALIGRIPIGAYVHYPTISLEMVRRVQERKQWHTNSDAISSSTTLSKGKLLYYHVFMYYYSRSLRRSRFLMVNSTWTKNHVDAVMAHSDLLLDILHLPLLPFLGPMQSLAKAGTQIVYPPCSTVDTAGFPLEGRERIILSVAQFRPEKDHAAQLYSFRELLKVHPEYRSGPEEVKLVLLGGARNDGDRGRVESLRALAAELGITESVQFVVNASYPDLLDWMRRSSIGLSTMVDEHFGINVVELMAAGLVLVAHASGGPLLDIVVPFEGQSTGFHATTPETFAAALHDALALDVAADLAIRRRARAWAVRRFSDAEFEKGWDASGWKEWRR